MGEKKNISMCSLIKVLHTPQQICIQKYCEQTQRFSGEPKTFARKCKSIDIELTRFFFLHHVTLGVSYIRQHWNGGQFSCNACIQTMFIFKPEVMWDQFYSLSCVKLCFQFQQIDQVFRVTESSTGGRNCTSASVIYINGHVSVALYPE